MGYHIYAIGKAIRALFADRVTYDYDVIWVEACTPIQLHTYTYIN